MALIATLIEPHGVTRILFDCRNAAAKPTDLERIARAIDQSTTAPDCRANNAAVTPMPPRSGGFGTQH